MLRRLMEKKSFHFHVASCSRCYHLLCLVVETVVWIGSMDDDNDTDEPLAATLVADSWRRQANM